MEVKPGLKFPVSTLKAMLPDAETVFFFGKVYDLDHVQLSTLLYTVLPRSGRYKAQNFLDVALFRAGDVASAQAYDALADPEEGLGWDLPATAFLAAPACLLLAGIGLHLGRRFDARAAEARA